MAKIRSLKGEYFRNARISRGGLVSKVLAAGLITAVADDEGRFKADSDYLRGEIFTHDEVAVGDVDSALEHLAKVDFIRVYRAHGRAIGCIKGWSEHQPVPPSRFVASKLPAPPNTKERKHSPTERKQASTAVSSRAGVGSDRIGIGEEVHGDVVGGGASVNGLTFAQAAENLVVPVDPDITGVCIWFLVKRGWESFSTLTIAKHERAVAGQMLQLMQRDGLIAWLDVAWQQTDPDDRPSSLEYFWTRLQDEQHAVLKQQRPHARTDGLSKIEPASPKRAPR